MNDLKIYCKYLIDEYIKVNENALTSSIYRDLTEYYEEGKMKDLIYKKTKRDKIIFYLLVYKDYLEIFIIHKKLNIKLLDFHKFSRKLKIKSLC